MNASRYVWLPVVILIASIVVVGCAGKRKGQLPPKDPTVLYKKGITLFNKGRYKQAEEVFTRLKEYFPSDELYALKAELRIADCYFQRKEYPEAVVRYTEFQRRNPFHPDVPYAAYQIGSSYYKQILSRDRDQEFTMKALTVFENVVSNYPDTIFAQRAREKIAFCRRRLAEHECYIGHFYRRKDKDAAAAQRFSTVVEKYSGCGVEDQALYYLGVCLHKEKRDEEALAVLTRLVQEHPDCPFSEKAENLRANIKAEGVVAASPTPEGRVVVAQAPKKGLDENFPFRITAQRQEQIPGKNTIMYTGDVVARGPEVVIRSDLLVLTKDGAGKPEEMVARGEVRILGGGEEIFCKKAMWTSKERLLVMTGDAKIRGLGEWIRGDEITLQIDSGKIEVKGRWVEGMEELRGG